MTFARRICADILLFTALFVLPWWATLALGVMGIFLFNNFYEFLVIGFVLDSLYGTPGRLLPAPILYTLLCVALYVATVPLKRRLKFY